MPSHKNKSKPGSTEKDEYTKQKLEKQMEADSERFKPPEAVDQPCTDMPKPERSQYTRLCQIEQALRKFDCEDKELEWRQDEPRIQMLRTSMEDLLEQVQAVEVHMKETRSDTDSRMRFGIDPEAGLVSGIVPSGRYYEVVSEFIDDTLKSGYIHPIDVWMQHCSEESRKEYFRRFRIPCSLNDHGRQDTSELEQLVLFWDKRGIEFVLQELAQLQDLFGCSIDEQLNTMSAVKAKLSCTQRKFIDLLQKYPAEHRRSNVLKELPRVDKLLTLHAKAHARRQLQFDNYMRISLTPYDKLRTTFPNLSGGHSRLTEKRVTKSVTSQKMTGTSVSSTIPDVETTLFKRCEKLTQKSVKKKKRGAECKNLPAKSDNS